MVLLGRVADGRNGNSCLAANTLGQAFNIVQVLRDIETNAWFQHHFAENSFPLVCFCILLTEVSQMVLHQDYSLLTKDSDKCFNSTE